MLGMTVLLTYTANCVAIGPENLHCVAKAFALNPAPYHENLSAMHLGPQRKHPRISWLSAHRPT